MNLQAIESVLDITDEQLLACRRHGIQEFTREADRCRERAAQARDPVEREIWREAARRIDHGAAVERARISC